MMGATRLFCDDALAPGVTLRVEAAASRYLVTVMRLRVGETIHVFNERDGEWSATLREADRRGAVLEVAALLRPPSPARGPTLVMAPIRRSRLDWLVEKAVELGVGRIVPVLTARTVVHLDKPQRLHAIAREAAEQCGRLDVPPILRPQRLEDWLRTREPGRTALFADEAGDAVPILRAGPADAILIGPEGGFAPDERAHLRTARGIVPVSLGPAILRAETAALTALAALMLTAAGGTAAP